MGSCFEQTPSTASITCQAVGGGRAQASNREGTRKSRNQSNRKGARASRMRKVWNIIRIIFIMQLIGKGMAKDLDLRAYDCSQPEELTNYALKKHVPTIPTTQKETRSHLFSGTKAEPTYCQRTCLFPDSQQIHLCVYQHGTCSTS